MYRSVATDWNELFYVGLHQLNFSLILLICMFDEQFSHSNIQIQSVQTYGAETLRFTKPLPNKLRVTKRKISAQNHYQGEN